MYLREIRWLGTECNRLECGRRDDVLCHGKAKRLKGCDLLVVTLLLVSVMQGDYRVRVLGLGARRSRSHRVEVIGVG